MKIRMMLKVIFISVAVIGMVGSGVLPVVADEDEKLLEKPKAYVGSKKMQRLPPAAILFLGDHHAQPNDPGCQRQQRCHRG